MKSLSDKINAKLDAQGGFLKAVSILVGGTVFAQGIAVISLPILTRIYSPKDFSLFAVYASLLMILSVASCLRFEIAIPIPKEDSEATDLILLALISNFFISILIGLVIWLFHTDIIMLLNQPDFSKLIWLVPIGVFFAGIYNALQYWATRKKNFNLIAKTRIVQSVSGVSIQIIMGITGFLTIGLIIGQIVKVSAGIRRLANNFWYDSFQYVKNIEFKKLKDTFKRNDQFPKYSTFEALANTASIQLPVIIIAALSIGSEAGYLMLAMQIMAIPMKLIGGAVSQVYLANAQDEIQKGTIKGYTVSLLKDLIKYGVSTLILIGVISPLVVQYIFGNDWLYVGILISYMIPWFIFQLLSSPISMIMHIMGKQKEILLLTVFGFFLKISALYVQYYIEPKYLLENYAISSAIFYSICFFIFSKSAQLDLKSYIYLVKKTIPLLIFTSSLAILIVVVLRVFGL